MSKNPFELLEIASNELKAQKDLTMTVEFKRTLENIKTAIPTIIKNPSLSCIYIYQFLRFLQHIDLLIVLIRLEQNDQNSLVQILSSDIRTILKQLFQENSDISETCGREFVRFSIDLPLISCFPSKDDEQSFFKPPKPEFSRTLIPKEMQEIIDENINDIDLLKTQIQDIVSQRSQYTVHLLICDMIRYIFSTKRISFETKTDIIKSFIQQIPNWKYEIGTFEICIALCIDILTFKRQLKEDETNVKVCIALLKEFPELKMFTENLACRHDYMRVSLAEAAARFNEPKLFNIVLPNVEPEAPKIDIKEALKAVLLKLKWQKKDASNVLSEFSSQVLPNLLPCFFDIPFKPNEELISIVKAGNPQLIASLCEKNQNILKSSFYEMKNEHELVEKVMDILVRTDANQFIYSALSKVLIIAPELIRPILKFIHLIPSDIDPTPFIRYISYNCTNNEIVTILKSHVMFPSVDAQVMSLFKQSLKWKETPQNVFWLIVNNAILEKKYSKSIFDAIEPILSLIARYPVAFSNVRMMMSRLQPSPLMSKLTEAFMKGNDEIQNAFVAIVVAWCRSSQDETVAFIQNRLKSFRAFFEILSKEQRSKIPETLITCLFPKNK